MTIESSPPPETQTGNPTVLIVDDSPLNLGVIVESLEGDGFEVLVALDGEEAFERIAVVKPDIILLDVMMPGPDGFEVCRRLKVDTATQDIPVIFMTSLSGVQDKLSGFKAGAVDYVTKPLQIDEVKARIDLHLKLRSLQRRLERKNAMLNAEVAGRRQAEVSLRKSLDLLRVLVNRQEVQHEEERRDVVHKVREEVAQNLSALRLTLSMLQDGETRAKQAPAFAAMGEMVDRSLVCIRHMVASLRPSVIDMGIAPAIRWLADDFTKGVGLHFDVDVQEDIRLADADVTFLFRAAQEALFNATLHGVARNIRMSLTAVDRVCHLSIGDDGRGFDPAAPRAAGSLLRLAEQAASHGGELSIDAAPGRGTTVRIAMPFSPALAS